jgi:ankyrin repeat protein
MPFSWRGSGSGELNLLGGGKRRRDPREEKPEAGLYEDAPVFGRQRIAIRYSPHSWNTLWGAAALGYANVVTRFLEKGTPVDRRDAAGRTALHYAVEFRQTDILCLLLTYGADPNQQDTNGATVLHRLENGSRVSDLLTALVNAGADLDAPDGDDYTRLMRAAATGETRMVNLLLEAGACASASNRHGHTPLLLAAFEGRHRIIEKLQNAGAVAGFAETIALGKASDAATLPLNITLSVAVHNNETLLYRAARRGDFTAVRVMLERGADPSGGEGLNPLDAAADASRGRIVRLLLDHGADPERSVHPADILLRWAGR